MATRFVNGTFGAIAPAGGRPATKKDLKALVRAYPDKVGIEDCSLMGGSGPKGTSLWSAADIEPGIGYRTIVGPDPHTNRKWYASIERTEAGVLKVT